MVSKFKAIISLYRLGLSAMVAFSAMVGYCFSGNFEPLSFFLMATGVFLMAGGTSALNQIQECRKDALMNRTSLRPLVTGMLSKKAALGISLFGIISGLMVLLTTSVIAPLLGLLNIVLYNLIYTPLKTKTSLSIIPGALVGSIPPLMGWSAAGELLSTPAVWFIAVFIFLWQLPHFWLLLMQYGKEYQKAGFKVLPPKLSHSKVRTIVFVWTTITSGFLFLFPWFGINMNTTQEWSLVLLNLLFILLFYHLLFGAESSPRKAYIALNSYMAVIFLFLIWLVG